MNLNDVDACYVWCSDPQVNRFMSYPIYTDVSQAREWLTRMEKDENILLWGIERKADGMLIGSASPSWKPNESAMYLGYTLRRDASNQGYATEAASAILNAGRHMGYQRFVACHAEENVGIAKVIRRCGSVFGHTGEYAKFDGSETFPARFYTLYLD